MENVESGGANGWSRWRMAMWGIAAFLLLLRVVRLRLAGATLAAGSTVCRTCATLAAGYYSCICRSGVGGGLVGAYHVQAGGRRSGTYA